MMQPKACIPPPKGDSDPVEQLLDAGGGVLGVDSLGNGLPEERPNGGDGVLSNITNITSLFLFLWGAKVK